MRKIKTTKNGRYAVITKSGYINYHDSKEKIEKEEELYRQIIPPRIDLINVISVEGDLGEMFSKGFKRVLETINPNYTTLWINKQSMVDRAVIERILHHNKLPSVQNLFRLLYFIENHINNFYIWSLIDPNAPIKKTNKNSYEPFESQAGIFYKQRPKRNRKNWY